jgi:HPt (histidine-containing phosphotransfer) domain-containing protein
MTTGDAARRLLDLTAVEELVAAIGEGGEKVVAGLLATLFEDAPVQLADLRRGLVEGDSDQVRRAAHTLKSHASTFGATALADLALELEGAARDASLRGAEGLVGRVEEEYDRVRAALEAVRLDLLQAATPPSDA